MTRQPRQPTVSSTFRAKKSRNIDSRKSVPNQKPRAVVKEAESEGMSDEENEQMMGKHKHSITPDEDDDDPINKYLTEFWLSSVQKRGQTKRLKRQEAGIAQGWLPKDDTTHPLVHLGRFIPRFVCFFLSLKTTFLVSIESHYGKILRGALDGQDAVLDMMEDDESDFLDRCFQKIIHHFPPLDGILSAILDADDTVALWDMIAKIEQGFSNALQTDTNRAKITLPQIVNRDLTQPVIPPIQANHKGRGRNHPLLATLLLPYPYIEQFQHEREWTENNGGDPNGEWENLPYAFFPFQ
ncbi:hypothetical protein VKT23_019315 [Stygiomarasmius scandens]|uniref:Uncharacterized protein n=1 Tax=Marasmiellus scandens TaxID=2682957 RepID=A0ABR1IQZ7_9AGAR